MALQHLLLSNEVGAWPHIGSAFVAMAAGRADQPFELLETGVVRTEIGDVLVYVQRLDDLSAEIHEEDKGFRPTMSVTFRARWEVARDAEIWMLGICGRYIASRRPERIGLYRNYEHDFLVWEGGVAHVFGVDSEMHEALAGQLGDCGAIVVERWLGARD